MIRSFDALTEAYQAWDIPGETIVDLHAATTSRTFDVDPADAQPVVLPVKNEAAELPAALWTLARSEVKVLPVVVDNGSTDNSKDIALAMGAHVVEEPKGSKMAATQAGITYACEELKADTVLFSDGDTVFPRFWAGSIIKALRRVTGDNGAAVYGGSLYWCGASRVTDAVRTALSFKEIRQRIKAGDPPKAKGVNYGISFDRDGAIREAIGKLDPDFFMHDDMLMRDAMIEVKTPVIGQLDLRSIVVTKGDRINNLRELIANRRGRGSHMKAAYEQEYGDTKTYKGDTWI